ncbi:hypothetical protein N9O57_00750 [bacterium]|nr:hypothetical protein [bacterium]
MIFSKIFIEKNVVENPYAKNILDFFSSTEITEIDKLENYFEKVKKPYLQKRENLNLFIGEKKGELVKKTPDAYGQDIGDHYYYVHAYNCIYECEYCYLQGYFQSPDLVLFVNHHEIVQKMSRISLAAKDKTVWFHAGEYSDSLALAHVTKEIHLYHEFAKNHPNSIIELRTKSANIKEVLKLEALENFICSFSLSPSQDAKDTDHKTAPIKHRLLAIKKLHEQGHPIAVHFDPIIYRPSITNSYSKLFDELALHIELSKIRYTSLGVVRFTSKVLHELKRNYPKSTLLEHEFVKSFDNKIRYPKPLRMNLLGKIKNELVLKGAKSESIYLCME